MPGNHEYGTDQAAGYQSYFDLPSYYARDLGAWRVYYLDSNCDRIDCDQEAAWLSDQLAEQSAMCTAVAWHHPRWSSGAHGSTDTVQSLWRAAVDGGVDLALSGHEHDYERFGHLDSQGSPTSSGGTREFVVGTGGKSLYDMRANPAAGSEFRQNTDFGVLDLRLTEQGYDWKFVNTDGQVMDRGSDLCRG